MIEEIVLAIVLILYILRQYGIDVLEKLNVYSIFSFMFTAYPIPTIICLVSTILIVLIVYLTRPKVVNGGWSDWTSTDTCDQNTGTITMSRTCTNPAPANGGISCEGDQTLLQTCDIDGVLSKWNSIGTCSASCGNGVLSEFRTCKPHKNNGKPCSGDLTKQIPCKNADCPINGGWSLWSSLGETCSESCGNGVIKESRSCTNPQPEFEGISCEGEATRMFACKNKDCPKKGTWSEWSVPSNAECSEKCGGGLILETRTCIGDTECEGESSKLTKPCNTNPCPKHGGWTEWTLSEQCSKPCNSGKLLKTRTCTNPVPAEGGQYCIGESTMNSEISCNTETCPLSKEECDSLIGPVNGTYPKECLNYWWKQQKCTNMNFTNTYPENGTWNLVTPNVVKNDMSLNYAQSIDSTNQSYCMPKNWSPTNQIDCLASNSYWNDEGAFCDSLKTPCGGFKKDTSPVIIAK
jgi:hypothetical protein